MAQSTPLQWIETLDLYGPSLVEGLKPDQSAEIEKKMYEAAVSSVKVGYHLLSQLKVPASRRSDYFAEMLKSDKQMSKIRARVVTAQLRVEAVESRKKKQAQRKFSKQLRAAKIEKKKEMKIEEKLSKTSAKSIAKKNGKDLSTQNSKDNKGHKGKKPSGRDLSRPKKKFALKQKYSTKSKPGGKSMGKKGISKPRPGGKSMGTRMNGKQRGRK